MKKFWIVPFAALAFGSACGDGSATRATEPQFTPGGLLKDDVANRLDNTIDAAAEVMPLNVGGANGSTTLFVDPTNGDGKNGCNLTGSTTLVISALSSNPAVATASLSNDTFTSCGDTKTLTVTPVGQGTTTISVTQVSNNTGAAFNFAPATFTVNVSPPPNTAPRISITGVAGGQSYVKGSVPAAGCSVTDAEDGPKSFAASLSPITGPNGADGIGSQTASCTYTDAGGLMASSSVTYAIIAPATSTTLASSANPSTPGQSVTFTATVKSGTPLALIGSTGTVTFKTGGTDCSDATDAAGPTSVVDGVATWQTSTLSLGNTTVRACYDGAGAYLPSEEKVIQSVNTLPTTTTLESSLSPSTYGTSVTFTAIVKSGSPAAAIGANGAVTFKTGGSSCSDATALSSSVALGADGKATYETSSIPAGTTVVRACYDGAAAYDASAGTFSQVVNKAPQTITFAALADKTYGDAAFSLSATGGASGNAVTFALDATSVGCSLDGATVTITGATPAGKSCVINANQAGNDNYFAAEQVQRSFEIAKAKLTVKATATSKYYGDPDPSPLGYQITSGALVGADKLTGALDRVDGETVAGSPYAISQGTLAASANYDLTFVGANLTIKPRPIVIKAVSVSKTYDGSTYPGSFTIEIVAPTILGFSESIAVLGTPQFSTAPSAPVNAGTYPITVSGLSNGNYAISYVSTGALTIDPRPISVTADAKSKYYGQPDPAFTYRITAGSLVSGDAISGALTREAGEFVGTYDIKQGSLTAGSNYALTFFGASLTIQAWTTGGFYQPVDMNGVYNTVKGGSTVPLKFELFAGPTELTATSSVKSFTVTTIGCASNVLTDDIELTTTGGTSLRYDASGGQFIQNWQTPTKPGTCYRVVLNALDGSTITAFFKLK
jgi:hypothetical protein